MLSRLSSYNFHVRLGIVPVSIGFQKISGIQHEIETMTYQEGGNNRSIHVFCKSVTQAGTLIMERGRFLIDPTTFLVGDRISYLSIDVMSNEHIVLRTYIVKDAIVKKWSVSELSAQDSALQIDHFEIEYGDIYHT